MTSQAFEFTGRSGLGGGLIRHYAAAARLQASDAILAGSLYGSRNRPWQKKTFASVCSCALGFMQGGCATVVRYEPQGCSPKEIAGKLEQCT